MTEEHNMKHPLKYRLLTDCRYLDGFCRMGEVATMRPPCFIPPQDEQVLIKMVRSSATEDTTETVTVSFTPGDVILLDMLLRKCIPHICGWDQ